MSIVPAEGNRWSLFPLHHPDIMEEVKKAQASIWFADELRLSEDRKGFEQLTKDQQYFILMVLAFFANSDGLVTENLALNFYEAIDIPEIRYYYATQILVEGIHAEAYALLIDAYVQSEEEKKKLYDAYSNYPAVRSKLQWAEKWLRPSTNIKELMQALVGFIAVEGISFSSSFCAIFWCREQGFNLEGLYQTNDYVNKEELNHADFGVKVYKKLVELGYPPLTNDEVIEIISGCVDAEISFCKDSLPVSLLGMNSDLMIQYVKNVADGYLNMLIGESYYKLPNPFIFMEKLNLDLKTDFFSGKVTNYQQAGIAGGQDELQFGF
jgi:ribonucleoside-diphosphate reductase beta chain